MQDKSIGVCWFFSPSVCSFEGTLGLDRRFSRTEDSRLSRKNATTPESRCFFQRVSLACVLLPLLPSGETGVHTPQGTADVELSRSVGETSYVRDLSGSPPHSGDTCACITFPVFGNSDHSIRIASVSRCSAHVYICLCLPVYLCKDIHTLGPPRQARLHCLVRLLFTSLSVPTRILSVQSLTLFAFFLSLSRFLSVVILYAISRD